IGTGPGAGGNGTPAGGGSHGGRGGYSAGPSGPVYGSAAFPADFGSGGGVSGLSAANGGGLLFLEVTGELRVDGRLSARGDSATTVTPTYSPGGGAGGSVRVISGSISGTGDIDASGGPGFNAGGGGGGGRISVETLCWDGFSLSQLRVAGGAGGTTPAQPGTVWPDLEVGIAAGPIALAGSLRAVRVVPSLAEGMAESADTLIVLKERGGLQLAAGDTVRLQVSEPGVVSFAGEFTPAELGPGTWLNSHVLHLDPPGAGEARAAGSVTFDTNVLGLIVTSGGLDSSQALLHAPGLDYQPGDRGLEFAGGAEGDTIALSADRRTVTLSVAASSQIDEVRVITAVPLLGCGDVAGVAEDPPPMAGTAMLAAPFPNPSRGEVVLRFALSSRGRVRLAIHDLAGRQVVLLADREYAAGWHVLSWRRADGEGVPPGIYFARLSAGGGHRSARIVLAR
ncbi:MAG: T9SS type A sorting domain-containing protein, partial [Microbacteriaceae bacterium]|nr:T9SS type A sorting domain-containing protein [Microbacteriaceae bacterium]